MAIVTYKCDTCKREIELQRNVYGLETPQRCKITHGCRGKLYQLNLKQDFIRGKIPARVTGLDDWQQRKVLYDHSQSIERDEWNIEHNLGNSVSVSVFVDRPTEDDPTNRDEIEPDDIIIVSPDEITLTFSRPYSGIAQLVARASDPQLLNPTVSATTTTTTSQQISNLGELTIATRIATVGQKTNVGIQLTYNTPQQTIQVADHIADDAPAIASPWSTFDKVVIKGSVYTVRSFNAIVARMATGVIGNGSTFRFTGIDEDGAGSPVSTTGYRAPVKDEVLLLLASSPFTTVDKITTQIIDVSQITESVNPFSLSYDTGEFFANTSILQTIYPPVRST